MSKYTVRFFTGDYAARQRAANAAKAVVYVEQHFNSASDPKAAGVEVLVATNSSSRSKALGTAYAKRIAADLGIPLRHSPTGLIVGGYNGRGNGNLSLTAMPAVLLETCYASNPVEAAMIRDDFKQRIMAKALADVIREQFPNGGLIAFSVGHKGKTSHPADRGAPVVGGGMEAEYAETVLNYAANLLQGASAKASAEMVVAPPADVPTLREVMGKLILGFEARKDTQGRLAVYKLPKGDGGGTYEVAGINDRYHPRAAGKLREMIESNQHSAATEYAAEYLMGYTDCVRQWFETDGHDVSEAYPQVEFFLRDTAFNRGAGGAASILQKALSVPVDGHVGPFTRSALAEQLEDSADELLDRLRAAREWYERNKVGRDESSKFWKGLVNRWNKAVEAARSLV